MCNGSRDLSDGNNAPNAEHHNDEIYHVILSFRERRPTRHKNMENVKFTETMIGYFGMLNCMNRKNEKPNVSQRT